MRKILSLLALIGTLADCRAFEALQQVPLGWKTVGRPKPSQPMRLSMALVRENPQALHDTLMKVSTPGSPEYGKHLSYEELSTPLKPRKGAQKAVKTWLSKYGASEIEFDRDWVKWKTTVSEAEEMLGTKFNLYESEYTSDVILRTLSYHVPKSLNKYVYMIQPTTRFGHYEPERSEELSQRHRNTRNKRSLDDSQPAEPTGEAPPDEPPLGPNTPCAELDPISPACIKYLYQMEDYKPKDEDETFLGISGFYKERADPDDLALFEKKFAKYAQGANFSAVYINGADQTVKKTGYEANLDVQIATALGYPVPTKFYYLDGTSKTLPEILPGMPNEPWLEYVEYLLKLPDSKLPTTITHSYGENEQTVPEKYARSVCDMLGQLGARGVSLLFSSGDNAVGAACVSNDGKNTTKFQAHFPASCPYVTAVGGTTIDHARPIAQEGPIIEQAAGLSGGGFSEFWERPAYQKAAVQSYLDIIGDRYAPYYNHDGRGYPDVSALAAYLVAVDDGQAGSYGTGTSAAVPLVSGIIAQLNSARVARNKPPLGFLNPWIYGKARTAWNDITAHESNAGCRYAGYHVKPVYPHGPGLQPGAGWTAEKGWDGSTGLGSPNFPKLLKAALAV